MEKKLTLSILGLIICLMIKAQQAQYQELPIVTNGPVYALSKYKSKYYLGGDFTLAGTRNNYFAGIDSSLKYFHSPFPKANNTVYKCVSNGLGGFFLLGDFIQFGDSSRFNFAEVDSNLSVTGLKLNISISQLSDVKNIGSYGNYIFISILGDYLKVFDKTTGNEVPNLIITSNSVSDFEIQNNFMYLCGYFDFVNSQPRQGFAKVNLNTFAVDAYIPYMLNANDNSFTYFADIELRDTTVILGGKFYYGDQNGPVSENIIEFSLNNGYYTSRFSGLFGALAPRGYTYYHNMSCIGDTLFVSSDSIADVYNLNQTTAQLGFSINTHNIYGLRDVKKLGNTFYAVGSFQKVNNIRANGIIKIKSGTNIIDSIGYMNRFPFANIYSLSKNQNTLFIGGNFMDLGLEKVSHFVCYDTISKIITMKPRITNLTAINPMPYIKKIKHYRDKIYVIGAFHEVNNAFKPGLFVFDDNTHVIQPFPSFVLGSCTFSDRNIYDFQFENDYMYLSGYFSDINGSSRNDYAKINIVTNTVTPVLGCGYGSSHSFFDVHSPLTIVNHKFCVFPNVQFNASGYFCGPSIHILDTTTMCNGIEICGIDTMRHTKIEEAYKKGNTLRCVEMENTSPVKVKTYDYNLSTSSYSNYHFDSEWSWFNTSNHTAFFKNYWIVSGAPISLNGALNTNPLVYYDTLANAVVNLPYHPSGFVSALYSNDTVLVVSTYNSLNDVVYKTNSSGLNYSKIYVVKSLGNQIVTSKFEHNSLNDNQDVLVYPNPAVDNINISTKEIKEFQHYSIYNNMGILIREGKVEGAKLNVSDLCSGIYILSLDNKSYSTKIKFIKE